MTQKILHSGNFKDDCSKPNVATQGNSITELRSRHGPPPGNQTGTEPVPFLNCSKNCPTDIQNPEQHVTTTITGDTTIPPLTTTTPLIDDRLVRDEQTNEVYLQLFSTAVLKQKQEMLYVPLNFEKHLTADALVDLEVFASAIA